MRGVRELILQRFAPHLLLALTCFVFSPTTMAAPPDVPTNFAASDGTFSNKIQLTWDDVAGEDYYQVLSCVGACTFLAQVSADETSFDYMGATPGQAESFAVRSCQTGDFCSADSTQDVGFAKNGSTPPTFSIGSASGVPDSLVALNVEFTAGWVGIAEATVIVSWPTGPGKLTPAGCDENAQTVGASFADCDFLPNGDGVKIVLGSFSNFTTGVAAALVIGIPADAPSSTQLTITIEAPKNDAFLDIPTDYVSVSAGTISTLAGGISADERAALVNFYTATIGFGWDFTDNWLSGDPCLDDWHGVICDNNETMVTGLNLPANLLSGSLVFDAPNLGNLSNLTLLNVSRNAIGGPIPTDLGSLQVLEQLFLGGNKFTGMVPSQLINLTTLTDGGGLDINYNLLSAVDGALDSFLDTKSGNNWSATQTVTPTQLQASGSNGTANLTFNPIEFSSGSGEYTVRYTTNQGSGPWTTAGSTADKTASSFQVTSLTNGETYYFQVRTGSDSSSDNPSNLVSAYSAEVSLMMGIPQETIFESSFE